MYAYLVSHNGLGDNLFMIGAVRYLSSFYEKIFFLCKDSYFYENVKLFYIDNPNIICIPFNKNNEYHEIMKIIEDKYNDPNIDIFICGHCHKSYLQSKILNHDFLNHTIKDNKYTIDFDTLTTKNYSFIENFYLDAHLNLTYFYEYFYLPSFKESKELYDSIKHYYIVFIHLYSSDGIMLNVTNIIHKYINMDNVLLVCFDKNLYDNVENKNEKTLEKYNLCVPFVCNKIVNYVDTIKNSDEIYIIDSCFTGVVLPYVKTKKLKTEKVRIIYRNDIPNIVL